MSLGSVNVKKKFLEMFFKVLTAIKINSFEQKLCLDSNCASIQMFNCASIEGKGYLPCIVDQKDITISLMTMETTNIGKNQKFNRKVRESVEAI